MGLFKNMRNLTKQAKELQKTTPAPGMGDMVKSANSYVEHFTQQQAENPAILQNGVPGTGIIRVMGTPARGASHFNLDLDLEVHVEGRDAYRIANQYIVPSTAQLGLGVELPIRVDRDDPAKIAIDWDRAPTAPTPGQIRPA